ncbi:hypothetical protein EVAR_50569_1 [Eumeta japonica]|uniref:Uncharacterized protein n=1 Tax=Eumeta variegata TaxID=151549 RepID=A0A4C1ZGC9_EUMVA|nr:hypothetical protein EVAR_50569_1 [Eumeta japonica]
MGARYRCCCYSETDDATHTNNNKTHSQRQFGEAGRAAIDEHSTLPALKAIRSRETANTNLRRSLMKNVVRSFAYNNRLRRTTATTPAGTCARAVAGRFYFTDESNSEVALSTALPHL